MQIFLAVQTENSKANGSRPICHITFHLTGRKFHSHLLSVGSISVFQRLICFGHCGLLCKQSILQLTLIILGMNYEFLQKYFSLHICVSRNRRRTDNVLFIAVIVDNVTLNMPSTYNNFVNNCNFLTIKFGFISCRDRGHICNITIIIRILYLCESIYSFYLYIY